MESAALKLSVQGIAELPGGCTETLSNINSSSQLEEETFLVWMEILLNCRHKSSSYLTVGNAMIYCVFFPPWMGKGVIENLIILWHCQGIMQGVAGIVP